MGRRGDPIITISKGKEREEEQCNTHLHIFPPPCLAFVSRYLRPLIWKHYGYAGGGI
jgi:hypothetical protein